VEQLLLAASDLGMTETEFQRLLAEFKDTVSEMRYQYKNKIAEQIADTKYVWAYEKLPMGSRIIASYDDTGKRTLMIYDDQPETPKPPASQRSEQEP
jgi:hypothetical protein